MGRTRVTIIQFEEDAGKPRHNLDRMKAEIRAHRDSDLVVFPELALQGHEWVAEHPSPAEALRGADPMMTYEIDALAAELRASVVFGETARVGGQLMNLATFTNGEERVSYAKTHVHWSEAFTPGEDLPVARGFARPLGMLICFDAAFPEVSRILALRGAEVIVNISAIPAAFPLKHVHRRLQACSVQNQVFTIFANRAGDGFLGGSLVVDPQGEVLATVGEHGNLTVDIDLDEVQRWREAEPLFVHRRPHIYKDIAQ